MGHSQIEHWWPITYDYGLIQAPFEEAAHTLHAAFAQSGQDVQARALSGDIASVFEELLPLERPYTKRLFVETSFGWTAYFTNDGMGSDPFPAMSLLARQMDATSMRICVSPPKRANPAVIWEVYGGASTSDNAVGYVRSIAAANDGGRWVYETSGAPFPFEDLSAEKAKRKRDRFTKAMLTQYLAEFGIPELEDEHLAPDGNAKATLLAGRRFETGTSMSLEQAKERLSR